MLGRWNWERYCKSWRGSNWQFGNASNWLLKFPLIQAVETWVPVTAFKCTTGPSSPDFSGFDSGPWRKIDAATPAMCWGLPIIECVLWGQPSLHNGSGGRHRNTQMTCGNKTLSIQVSQSKELIRQSTTLNIASEADVVRKRSQGSRGRSLASHQRSHAEDIMSPCEQCARARYVYDKMEKMIDSTQRLRVLCFPQLYRGRKRQV